MKKEKSKKKRDPLAYLQGALLLFGALTLILPMILALSGSGFSRDEAVGILIGGFGVMEVGAVLWVLRRRWAGKDISIAIGVCIGIALFALWQIL